MKISEAIARTDRLKPNSYSFSDKLLWLSQLDGRIKREIIDCCGEETAELLPYTAEADMELLVSEPFDELYIHYLSAQIDYFNGEYDRFNNSNGMFESALSAFRNFYNRGHIHRETKRNYF